MNLIPAADAAAEGVEQLVNTRTHPGGPVVPERIRQLGCLLPRLGITRIADLTGLDFVGLPVWGLVRPLSRSVSIASGKGLTPDLALLSGLAEAVELHCAESFSSVDIVTTAQSMASVYSVIDPDRLPRRNGQGYRVKRGPIQWSRGIDVIDAEPVYLPFDLVHADFRVDIQNQSGGFLTSTNGLGAGNDWDDAVTHALLEVIERDAIAISFLSLGKYGVGARVALSSLSELGGLVLERLHGAGLKVTLWDITSDVGIPCYCARISEGKDVTRTLAPPVFGAGCHPNSDVAVMRALIEAAQTRIILISGAREDISDREFKFEHDLELETGTTVETDSRDNYAEGNSRLMHIISRLQSIGIEQIVAVDITQSNLPLTVVRVVVAGLEGMPFSRNYEPGNRLKSRIEKMR